MGTFSNLDQILVLNAVCGIARIISSDLPLSSLLFIELGADDVLHGRGGIGGLRYHFNIRGFYNKIDS